MVNRVIQAKVLKMKRMRRAWAKPYSMKKTGPAKLPGVVDDDRVHFTKASGGRTVDPWLDKLFKDKNPFYVRPEEGPAYLNQKSVEEILRRSEGDNPVPRAQVLRDLAKMVRNTSRRVELPTLAMLVQSTSNAGSLQGEIVFHYVKLIHGRFNELRLYFASNQCFFVELVTRGAIRKIRRSILYGSKDRAMFMFNHGKICFLETIEEALPPKDALASSSHAPGC